ncbi:reprolysin-like metallopeptidase [Flavobacterium phycosphaerae]|uniref:reprolysin-like metallopeptidase n=1 Tax=Flavobacterium phycosphaerae TaxID=2697515 RepID=UPI00138B0C83|nr:zinc-dependent metalloprotease family protein [Flavobacterium phycosphaerae]
MKYSLLAIILLISTVTLAQKDSNLWKANTKGITSTIAENKKSLTRKQLFELDINGLKQRLVNAPKRFASKEKSNITVSFPNSEGQLENFYIQETSNMDAALAAKYPDIKSYVGQGIENPTARVYFSLSPLGLQSMIIYADRSAVFIEPFTTDLSTYVVYRKTDKALSLLSPFECKVINTVQNGLQSADLAARPNADDALMRTYRLALSVTGEYTVYFGGTKALALAAMNNTMTRVNGVFEIDFGVHMNLIANNDVLIYTNASTDPYSAAATGSGGAWNTELQNNLTTTIGNAAYDIGHLFGASGGGGNAGCIGCVCVDDTASTTDENKGSGFTSPGDGIPSGDNFDIDYVAHEMGHQFGANHTWTHGGNEGTGTQMEPGSGSTIMGYAGITTLDVQPHSDAYFHAISIQQVTNYIKTTTCQTNTATGNAIPTASAGLDYTIPKSTPFMLTGSGTDTNGDALTYIWEQMDSQTTAAAPSATKTTGVNFRSYTPTTSPTRYFPKMSSVLTGATTTAGTEITVEALSSVARTLNFRFTVRDNHAGGPANNSDDMVVTVNATAGPFAVTIPNTAVSYPAGSAQTVTWNVAGTTTNSVNCANVDILISTNGGTTWSTLLAATPNDGSESVTMPATVGTTNRIMIKGTNHIFFDVSNTNFTITAASSDTTPPSAPTLTASGTTVNSTNLSWTTSTDNVGVTGYEVYQGGVLIGTTTTATTFAVTGLTPATSYAFTVKAKDAAGNFSAASNTVNVTTLSDTTAPTAPVLSASGTTSTTTNLSWTTATDNVAVTGYDVYKDGVLLGSTTTATTYAVSGLIANTTYVFTVKAKDNAGNISSASNALSVTTTLFTYCTSQGNNVADEVIGRVQLGTIDNTSTGGTGYTDFTAISTNLTRYTTPTITITPTWTSTAYSEGYAVFIDYNKDGDFLDSGETVWTKAPSTTTPVSGTFTIPATATLGATRMRVSLKFNAIPTACETYTYGQVEDYTVVIVADTTAPTAPTGLTASGTTQRTTNLSWTAATDNAAVTGYDVYKGAVLIGSTTTATTFAVSGLTYATAYAFTVKAKDASGNISASSNTANVTTLTPPTTTATACSSYTWSVNNQTYTTTGNYTGINASGDTEFLNLTITSCASVVTVKFNIEGFYDLATHAMRPVKANQGIGSSATDVDTITLELKSAGNVLVGSTTAVLQTNGTAVCNFTSVPNGSYYLVVKHRNAIETWSATTQAVSSTTPLVYDFRTAANKAYGSNMKLMEAGVYAFYSGDLNQDGFIEIADFSPLFNDSDAAVEGNAATDLNGDGFVEISDFSILFNNSDNAVESKQP